MAANVIVRQIKQNGGKKDQFYKGPQFTTYLITVDGKRYDSRLSKALAMKAARHASDGRKVAYEPCNLVTYGAKQFQESCLMEV